MTPKEKAEKMYSEFHYRICNDNGISENDSTEFCAKQCALICVDEILKSFDSFMDQRRHFRHSLEIEAEKYWQQVKTEIEKL